ncbi:hypothetical protein ACTXJ2_01930 [Psychrobacter alimentarius]|uniref:hypothetical protein n=1 Tax=Psychrobacter alimentarius TaxID=261164 RepID=UPI003FBA2090
MSKSSLNVRIPEDQHKYLRLKSTHEDIDIQDIVADSIALYQEGDGAYLTTYKPLIDSKNKERNHGA